MSYWDTYTLIVGLYFMCSACGMGIVVPATMFSEAERGNLSWQSAHIYAAFTAYIPIGLTLISLFDVSTFGFIELFLDWLEYST